MSKEARKNDHVSCGMYATGIEKYTGLGALAHYETDIMARRGFRKRIPRKRYEAWSASTRYLCFRY